MISRPPRVNPIPPPDSTKVKLVVVGDQNVGKSAFCKVSAGKEFPNDYEGTVGSDYYMRNGKYSEGLFRFDMYDLSGEQVYLDVRNEFYKEAQALVLVYDVTKKASFDALDMWLRETSRHGGENLPVYVVGNKTDLDKKRTVPKAEAEKWVKTRMFAGYFEVSSKEEKGFLNFFQTVADQNG